MSNWYEFFPEGNRGVEEIPLTSVPSTILYPRAGGVPWVAQFPYRNIGDLDAWAQTWVRTSPNRGKPGVRLLFMVEDGLGYEYEVRS